MKCIGIPYVAEIVWNLFPYMCNISVHKNYYPLKYRENYSLTFISTAHGCATVVGGKVDESNLYLYATIIIIADEIQFLGKFG